MKGITIDLRSSDCAKPEANLPAAEPLLVGREARNYLAILRLTSWIACYETCELRG